jgi:hypothetical protein
MAMRFVMAGLVVAALAGGCKKHAPDKGAVHNDAGAQAAKAAPDAAPVHTAPAADDCALAVANMKKVAPDMVEGDDLDREDCLRLPREVVLCLQKVSSEPEAESCVHEYAALHPQDGGPLEAEAIPPEELATKDDCTKAVAHVKALLPPDEQKDLHVAEMIEECTQVYTKSDAKCILAAKTPQEVDACVPGGD